MDEIAVGQRQPLLGKDRPRAPVTVAGVGAVEHRRERTAPILLRLAAVIEAATEGGERHRVLQFHPSDRPVEGAGEMEDCIAHHLGLHPPDVHPLQKPILRILSDGSRPPWLGAAGGELSAFPAVGSAGDDEPVERLHPPAVLHELDGEPVEQLRMGGGGASPTEIEHARKKRLVEVPHPDVIHGHPRRQRIGPIGDPAGQRRAPPRARRRIGRGDPRVGAIGRAHRRAPRGFHRSLRFLDRRGRGSDLRLPGGVGVGLGPRRG